MRDIIIIGTGLGGLECGALLSEKGYHVTLLEQAAQIGGCLQSYERQGQRLDTGFHYVGGIEPGQVLHPIFAQLGLDQLPWQKLNPACADRIIIDGEAFDIPQGYDAFYQTLSARFPEDREGLKSYVQLLQHIAKSISQPSADHLKLFEQSAYDYLEETFRSPLLRQVLSGASLRLELQPDTLPLYSFACINNSFIQSAYRLPGGGQQIADHLAAIIRANGGSILTNTKVVQIIPDASRIRINTTPGLQATVMPPLSADCVISAISPSATMALLADEVNMRPVFRKRLAALPLTEGIFTTTLLLRSDAPFTANHATYLHTTSPWAPLSNKVEHLMIHPYASGRAIDLLTPVGLSGWQRDDSYKARKQDIAEQSIRLAETVIPGLRESIQTIYTSSPATLERYLGAPCGSAFGIRKDYRSTLTTVLSPKTPVRGLFLTGQNLHLHGILGVSMTALRTVEAVLNENNE